MDATNLTTREEYAKNLHDGSRFQKMLRLFPQCFTSGAETLRTFAKKNLKERQEALDCLMQENIKNVNDMIRGNIGTDRFKATKTTLLKDDGKYFLAMLGISDKQSVLPTEIGKDIF